MTNHEDMKPAAAKVDLEIAGIRIRMTSRKPMEPLMTEREVMDWRFDNFLSTADVGSDIEIDVDIVEALPVIEGADPQFVTTHFEDGKENWRLLKRDDEYIFLSDVYDRSQMMIFHRGLDRVQAFLLPKGDASVSDYGNDPSLRQKKLALLRDHQGHVWHIGDILYDFLQVLLISYLAVKRQGIFIHGCGLRDRNGRGYLCIGKSGTGKSTISRLWHQAEGTMILNDDRIILKRTDETFTMYSSPWHGEFCDYLMNPLEPVPVDRVYFLKRGRENKLEPLEKKKAFQLLFPNTFPTFWGQKELGNIMDIIGDLVQHFDFYQLEFRNDSSVVEWLSRQ